MIKYILIVIIIVLLLLIGYTQAKKEKSIEKYFDKTNIENKVSTNINNSSKSEIKIKVAETKERKSDKVALNFTKAQDTIDQDTTDNVSDFDKEMEENEKDIIIQSLEEKENLTQIYNSEEENIPVAESYDTNILKGVSMTPLELDNMEIENGLQPTAEYNDSSILEDIPMTESILEEIEASLGLQNTDESESNPLEAEGFRPI